TTQSCQLTDCVFVFMRLDPDAGEASIDEFTHTLSQCHTLVSLFLS
ncbi:hypothetical protein RMSM_00506, partial [Rhodopirellula maiorica SM1]